MASTIAAMGGKSIDPRKLNPYHVDLPKTEEQEKSESRQAFKILEVVAKQIAGMK
jgi:hypothetical protein